MLSILCQLLLALYPSIFCHPLLHLVLSPVLHYFIAFYYSLSSTILHHIIPCHPLLYILPSPVSHYFISLYLLSPSTLYPSIPRPPLLKSFYPLSPTTLYPSIPCHQLLYILLSPVTH